MMNEQQKVQAHKLEEANFPTTLHFALSEIDRDGLGSVISWHVRLLVPHLVGGQSLTDLSPVKPHGRSFLVRDKKRFVKEILPLWFRMTQYSSFQVMGCCKLRSLLAKLPHSHCSSTTAATQLVQSTLLFVACPSFPV